MLKQRCETCGQDWWDAHACPLKMTAALPVIPGRRIEFPSPEACACIGPQNGQPLCPCAMRGVIVRDGRYIVPERDLGPAA